MNANRNYVIGALLAATLALTACGSDVPSDADPKPYQGATSSASAPATTPATPPATAPALADPKKSKNPLDAPAVSEEEAKKNLAEFKSKPLGADVDAMFANPERVSSDVLTVFPEDKNNTKQVVREAMALYQDLVISEAFHQEREGTDDYNILVPAFADRFDSEFLETVKASTAEKGGMLPNMVVAPHSGILTFNDGKEYKIVAKDAFTASFNEPSVRIANAHNATLERPLDAIRLETDMHWSYKVEGDKAFTGITTVNIDVQPLTDGKWIIKQIGRGAAKDINLIDTAKVPNA